MSILPFAKQNPRFMQRLLAAGYAVLGAVIYIGGQHSAGAAFVVVAAAWFALSFSKFGVKRTSLLPSDSPAQK
jgi:hypothetical protein